MTGLMVGLGSAYILIRGWSFLRSLISGGL